MFRFACDPSRDASRTRQILVALAVCVLGALATGCGNSSSEGVADSQPAATTVKMDFFHKPLPDIPLPNDVATVVDSTSPTGRRINASLVAPTFFESRTRELADQLDGWGVFQPITIPFTAPLDVEDIRARHSDASCYDTTDDAVYVVDIDRHSPDFGKIQYVDVGNGNYPPFLERRDNYWDNDPRAGNMTILYDEVDEDVNHNGVLDPGEDTDADGVLDKPNYFDGATPARDDLAARTDASLTFYERETNTLIMRLLKPLRERTTYAVVVTRRIKDANGNPVGSPYPTINHTAQTEALRPLAGIIAQPEFGGLTLADVAFAFTFTTQSIGSHWRAVREGLYGYGVQAHLGREYPPEIDELMPMRDESRFPNSKRRYLLWGEQWQDLAALVANQFLDISVNSEEFRRLKAALQNIDFFVIGHYQSPQLFPRRIDTHGNLLPLAGDGELLPLNEQSWPPDLDRVPAKAYPETVYFTLAVPRKEVSVRGQGKPAPVVVLSHGYGSSRLELMLFAAYFARHGLATIAIDGPSHGLGLSPQEEQLLYLVLDPRGYHNAGVAVLSDRAFDQDNDGTKDPGADFWTAYLFHTRDVVRQFMLDYTQLIRIIRSWDGHKTWNFSPQVDLGEDGVPDIAGDFDGDGVLDIGGDAPIVMSGGSLGGIMSMVMGGAEPQISAIAPISGGGGYGDIGTRTIQGGAIEAFVLRMMGPLFVGNLDSNTGTINLQNVIVDLKSARHIPLGSVGGVHAGDTMIVENLASGKHGCALVRSDGRARASLQSDRGDRVRIVFYRGSVLVPGTECGLAAGAQEIGRLENFATDFTYHGADHHAGEPLVVLEEGLGRARSTPEVRRLAAFGQLILDPGDPAVYGPHLMDDPIEFPNLHERTGAHALVLTSAGDMNVPASSGLTYSRAAGLVDFLQCNTPWGRSHDQLIVDTYTAEAVDTMKRFTDSNGKGVLLDIHNFSGGDDIWTQTYQGGVAAHAPASAGLTIEGLRLVPPLRIGFDRDDALCDKVPEKACGKSAALFTLVNDTGQHAFDFPGALTDTFRARCQQQCTMPGDGDPCGCQTATTYDIGSFLVNMGAHYLATNGRELNADLCNSRGDCDYIPPAPAPRPASELP